MPQIIEKEISDSGIYHFIFEIKKEFDVKVGAAGIYKVPAGFYIYTGTAQKNLKSRIERHIKKDKKCRWHIDYLTSNKNSKFFAAYYQKNLTKTKECIFNMAALINSDFYLPRFGNSDCYYCPAHICGFYNRENLNNFLESSFIKKFEKF